MVKGIYLIINPSDPEDKQRKEANWAQLASKMNCDVPIFRVELKTPKYRMGCQDGRKYLEDNGWMV